MFKTLEWGTYLFFAFFLGSGIVWVWYFLPETKGATLEEMDRVFKSQTGAEDARLLAEARRDVGIDSQLDLSAIRRTSAAGEVFTDCHEEKTKIETV